MRFFYVAAEGHDIRHPRHLTQCAHDGPLHFGAQLVKVMPVAGKTELIDLAQRCRFRREFRRYARRQFGNCDSLQGHGARHKGVGVVGECHGNQRQAEQAFAAHQRHARRAVEFALDRHGDATLDFFRRVPGELRDNGYLGIGNVGIGLDRGIEVGAQSKHGHYRRGEQRGRAAMYAILNQQAQHRYSNSSA